MGTKDNQPLVSIMMPVLNGEYFLPRSLDSLLAQDYPHFEIIILDDMSTDATPEICQQYAKKDPRIRYILDDIHRNPDDAAEYLSTLVRGEYCMGVGDDDLWEPNYISRLLPVIAADPEIGLVYSNADYVDMEGNFFGESVLEPKKLYRRTNSQFANSWKFLIHRHIMPMVFGIFRTASYRETMPYEHFDEAIKNADILWVFKFLNRFKVESIDEVLFHYRNKARVEFHFVMGNYPKDIGLLTYWRFEIRHQWRFMKKLFEVIGRSGFSIFQRTLLRIRVIYFFIRQFTWVYMRTILGRIIKGRRPVQVDHQATVRYKALMEKKRAGEPTHGS